MTCLRRPVQRAPKGPECHTGGVRQTGRIALGIGISLVVGVVTLAVALYILLRVDPHAVLTSCSAPSVTISGITRSGPLVCPPKDPWSLVPFVTGILGATTVGVLLFRRRRAQQVPI